MNPLDEKFDPNQHEALFEQSIPGKEAGTVIIVTKAIITVFSPSSNFVSLIWRDVCTLVWLHSSGTHFWSVCGVLLET